MKKSKKNSFDLSAKCVYCGETHHKIISAHDMRRGIFGALKCPIADLGAVFYGSNGKQLSDAMTDVFKVMEELMAEYEKPSSDLQIRSMTTQNSHIKSSIEQEMLNAFGTLNREQNISCVCGNTEIAVSISDDHKILLRCAVFPLLLHSCVRIELSVPKDLTIFDVQQRPLHLFDALGYFLWQTYSCQV